MYMEKLLAALKLTTSKFYRCRFRVISGALALGMAVIVIWAYSGLYPEYSALVRAVAAYVG